MNAHYQKFCTAIKTSRALEKFASTEIGPDVQLKQAEFCAGIVAEALTIAGHDTKEAAAVNFVDFTLALRAQHQALGEKTAADGDVLIDHIEKLATAVYLDQVIEERLPTMKRAAREETRLAQALGREYIVSLMDGIL